MELVLKSGALVQVQQAHPNLTIFVYVSLILLATFAGGFSCGFCSRHFVSYIRFTRGNKTITLPSGLTVSLANGTYR